MTNTQATNPDNPRERSLARRLSLSLGMLNAAIIVLAAAACLLYVSARLEDQMTDRTERSVAFLGEALNSPLWSLDTEAATAIARGVILDRGVGLLEVRDGQGRVWVAHATDGPRFSVREATIVREGQAIGHVRFGLEDSLRLRAMWAVAVFGLASVAVVLLAQFVLVSKLLHALFRKPFDAVNGMLGGMVSGEIESAAREAMAFTEFKPLVGTFLGMSRTIRQQFQELRESEQKFRLIFTHSPVGIFRTSFSGRLVEANPAFARMFGYSGSRDLAVASAEWVAVHYADPSHRRELLAALEESPEGVSLEVEMRRKDGSVFLAAVIASLETDADMRPAFLNGIIEDITDRKRMERALAESEARYRDLFDTMPNGFYRSTPQGHFVDANPAFVRMLGYDSLEELKAVHIPTALYVLESERDSILDDNPEFVSQVENYRLRRKDGGIIRVEDNARYVKDENGRTIFHEGICRDVTDRWEALVRLRQSEEKFAKLFRLSPDAITLAEFGSGLVIDVNEAFSATTGFSRDEVVGRTFSETGIFGLPEARDTLRTSLEEKGSLRNVEFVLRRKDGALIDCVLSCQLLNLDNRRCFITVLRDITEFKRMQEMMVQTEKMVSVGGIAAGIAHEINNPLSIVMNTAQNLAMRTRTDLPRNVRVAGEVGLDMEALERYMQARGLHEFIQAIQDAALRAADIIRHMLDFSRRSESRRTLCHLPQLIDKAVNLARSDFDLRREYDFRQIEVVMDYDADLPALRCTETEIEQVVLNLLRNAAQAMSSAQPEGCAPRIVLRIRNAGDHLRLEVEDNGPGMPPEVQRRAFEPFFTTKPPGVGTGLGLSVSYFIVTRSHGGRMSVESAPGQGTRFILELPVGGGAPRNDARPDTGMPDPQTPGQERSGRLPLS